MKVLDKVQRIFNSPFLKSIVLFLVALTFLSGNITTMITFKTDIPLFITGHSAASLLLAYNEEACQKKSHLSNLNDPGTLIKELAHPDVRSQPLAQVLLHITKKNNLGEYCAALTVPHVNSENTLRWLIQPLFKIHPDISFQGLVLTIYIIGMLLLWFFFYYLAHAGVPAIYVLILSIVAISTSATQMPYLLFTQYPLLLPGLVGLITLLGFSIHCRWHQQWVLHTVFSWLLGTYLFFLYNLRTSYILPGLAVLILYYFFIVYSMKKARFENIGKTLYSFVLVMISSIACYIFIQKSVFPPEFKKDKSFYMTTHPIAHPLVLSLAIPANDFAKKQGIEWNDSVGELLAAKVDPKVKFDSPRYDKVLLTYYKSLWARFPKDMLHLYYEKFKSTGYDFAQNSRFIKLVMYPLSKLNGIILLFIQFVFLYLLLKNKSKLKDSFVFGVLSFSLTGLAMFVESGIIYSIYNACYHSFLTLWLVSLNLASLSLVFYTIVSLSKKIAPGEVYKKGDSLSF